MTRLVPGLTTAFFCLSAAATASADYAEPPQRPASDPAWHHDGTGDRYADPMLGYDPPPPTSSVRVFTGPALHLSDRDPQAGLFAAIDLGPATLPPDELADKAVPEIPAAYLEALEAGWEKHVLR